MDDATKNQLDALRPGDEVEIVDTMGARHVGVVLERRLGIDPTDEVRIRRSGGVPDFIPYSRIREARRA